MALGLLAALLVLAVPVRHGGGIFDEGLILDGGLRVAEGEAPYRDFWTMYGPASFYLVAGAFRLFGPSVLVMHLLWLAVEIVLAVEIMRLGWMLAGARAGWLALLLALSLTVAIRPGSGYPAVPALAGALGAVAALTARNAPLAAGLLVGATALFRPDFAAYGLAACAPCLLTRVAGEPRAGLAAIGRMAAGAAALALPAYGLLMASAGSAPMIEQLLRFPTTVLPPYARLPLFARWWLRPAQYASVETSIKLLALLVSLGALASALALAVRLLRDRRAADPRLAPALALSLLTLALANHARFRFDSYHAWPLLMAFAPVLAAGPVALARRPLRIITTTLALVVLLGSGFFAAHQLASVAGGGYRPLRAPRAAGMLVSSALEHYDEILDTIAAETRPGDYIFSGSTRHDRIYLNDALVYFLSERRIPTPYHELNRGLVVTTRIQAEIVAALEARRVRLLVLLDRASDEPNLSAVSSGVTLLDDYIRAHFAQHAVFGDHEIWLRREPD
jgi:hypothetical protein